jgi:S1-C subfamily serine protease
MPWALGVVVALVAGGAGAAIALAVKGSPAPAGTSSPPLPTAAPAGPSGPSTSGINVGAIAARVEPATVDITANGPDGEDEGTGMVLTASGTVLTNNHVVDGSTSLAAQVDGTGKAYTATVLGTDATDDVALLQLHGGARFKVVTIGNSDAITVGDQVVAVGNALALSGQETVTNGIISATQRSISVSDPSTGLNENLTGLFQTSAAINPGNSGGPLVASDGRVIGMNTAQAASTGSGQGASNVGFAIPINKAMAIARLIYAGKATPTVQIGPHAIMGVEVTSVACAEGKDGCAGLGAPATPFLFGSPATTYRAPTSRGAVVLSVVSGTPAEKAGLAEGDVIVSVDGRAISSPDMLTARLDLHKVGDRVTVSWLDQNGQRHSSTVKLVQGPNV